MSEICKLKSLTPHLNEIVDYAECKLKEELRGALKLPAEKFIDYFAIDREKIDLLPLLPTTHEKRMKAIEGSPGVFESNIVLASGDLEVITPHGYLTVGYETKNGASFTYSFPAWSKKARMDYEAARKFLGAPKLEFERITYKNSGGITQECWLVKDSASPCGYEAYVDWVKNSLRQSNFKRSTFEFEE
jgi:hypothetical protein